ncbi:hypothetical protein N7513_003336 [Penicillium frequentans]|uniref:BZIP domain-containing protein n=1 Tax=Penicillium frequentans TaxID=3151616 RepID=A0AAD6CI63_9EURO|nr:hypothetical protein N7494_013145 [Penicillium glabrum]KAJ5557750.1 hypothetical protein N7513_003336 [Penicillium glabrum]
MASPLDWQPQRRGLPIAALLQSQNADIQSSQFREPILCEMDSSGSREEAKRRKANSDASKRFRRRLKEIERVQAQCDHYRNERNFYRDYLRSSFPELEIQERPRTPYKNDETLREENELLPIPRAEQPQQSEIGTPRSLPSSSERSPESWRNE